MILKVLLSLDAKRKDITITSEKEKINEDIEILKKALEIIPKN